MDSKLDERVEKLDEEWINLMLLAKQIGLTSAEVKEFLKQQQE
ncbi:DNA-binding anti-repressor SinI [Neobacillus novalis]|uniref:DNA-binding anti-repressor SinI n=1 Tax=Neobacillus novalis TaxID=220687 RepID=A0AA95MNZ9_9BACI|nr:DNA-binding anti-repressor SinI [Neobacillus novalis]WHY86945.1 DNA-binding anti-repressor SinI [Neobacillus novalis]